MINPISAPAYTPPAANVTKLQQTGQQVQKQDADQSKQELKKTFASVFGEMLYTEMLKGMRKTLDKPAYFHGGPAEEIFTQQLDQVLAEKMAETSGESLLGSTFDAIVG
ncbi:MAG: rod-binding protein [Planctomycetia bacterium]|jgi:Rod binding domain-containing protein